MKIDIFNHIFPKSYYDKMLEIAPAGKDIHKRVRNVPSIVDLKERFRMMDLFKDYVQVICLAAPPVEVFGPPPVSTDMARLANDGMAELVQKYPDRFPGFIASLPMNDPDGLLKEATRAIKDYKGEPKSHYEIWWTFGWPYETSVAMAHLVFSGLFDRHPDIKIITHHMGGMIPYFEGRIGPGWDQLGTRTSDEDYTLLLKKLKKRPLDYFRLFYVDTALFGAREATICGLKFFGPERVLFGSDSPFDPEKGSAYIRWTIEVIDSLDIKPADRQKIYEGNARRLLKLK
jgi:predicted TIM-barrel fold metal-dependent hydrolase